jgi:hypothetical protein
MKNNDFDKFIKSSLERLETPYDAKSWQQLEEGLDKEEGYAAHDPVDDIARKHLRKIDTEYRPEYWEQMSKRLDEEYSLLRKIYKYKVIEAGLVLLILFTLINFLPTYPRLFHFDLRPAAPAQQQGTPALPQENREHAAAEPTLPAPLNVPVVPDANNSSVSASRSKTGLTGKVSRLSPGSAEANAGVVDISATTAKTTGNSGEIMLATTEITATHNAKEVDVTAVDLVNEFPAAKAAGTGTSEEVVLTAADIVATNTAEVVGEFPAAKAAGTAGTTGAYREVLPVDLLELKDPHIAYTHTDVFAPALAMADPTVSRRFFRIGVATALDIDHVTLPYSVPYENEPPYQQWSNGYSNGITAGLAANTWELEAAVLYSNKRYSSNKVIQAGNFYTGYYLDSLRNVELSLVKIPVSAHHNIFKKGRVKLYALVGAALNIAVTGNYDRDIVPWGNIAPGGPTALKTSIDRDGILEGGKFSENFYVSADAGIGMEYAVSPGLSLYAQGTYQQHLGDLGPNRDKINSLTLYVGAKHTL